MKKVKDGFQKRLRIRIGKLKFLDFLWLLGYYLSFFLNLKNMINTVVEKRLLYFVFTPTNLGQFSRFEICWSWHFQNNCNCNSFIFMIIDFTERKTIEIWTFCVKSNWLNILDLLMVFLRIILVDIGTFDGEQNNFWNKLFKFMLFVSPTNESSRK